MLFSVRCVARVVVRCFAFRGFGFGRIRRVSDGIVDKPDEGLHADFGQVRAISIEVFVVVCARSVPVDERNVLMVRRNRRDGVVDGSFPCIRGADGEQVDLFVCAYQRQELFQLVFGKHAVRAERNDDMLSDEVLVAIVLVDFLADGELSARRSVQMAARPLGVEGVGRSKGHGVADHERVVLPWSLFRLGLWLRGRGLLFFLLHESVRVVQSGRVRNDRAADEGNAAYEHARNGGNSMLL